MKGAGTHFHIEWLDEHTALFGPKNIELQDQFLKGRGGHKAINRRKAGIIGRYSV